MFVLLMASVGYYFILEPKYLDAMGANGWMVMGVVLSLGVLVVCVDILAPRRKLAILSGTFLGLIVGMLVTFALSFVVRMLIDQFILSAGELSTEKARLIQNNLPVLTQYVNIVIGLICSYLAISFILQTKDDFRFIVPYVEFSKQTKGSRPIVLDTSVLIDGRISDIANTGLLDCRLIVPQFILDELQSVADSPDRLKRNRGRRGLDVLAQLQNNKFIEVALYDSSGTEKDPNEGVDARLTNLASELNGRLLSNDFNLNKVAHLRGVAVINVNDLATALKPVVLPGERMTVRLIKPGESPGQGVGYLVDGTMVVVDQGRPYLNQEVEFSVTSVLQTSAGKMIFGRMVDGVGPSAVATPEARRPSQRPESSSSTAG